MKGDWAVLNFGDAKLTYQPVHEAVLRTGASYAYNPKPAAKREGSHARSPERDAILEEFKKGRRFNRQQIRDEFKLSQEGCDSLLQRMERDKEVSKYKGEGKLLMFGAYLRTPMPVTNDEALTWKQNCRMKATNRMIKHGGQEQCVSAWADDLGMPASCLLKRIKAWGVDEAFARPWKPRAARGAV